MKKNNSHIKNIFCSVIIMLIFLFITAKTNAQEIKLFAISNTKGSPAEMNFNDLCSVMKGEKQRWNDGTKISIALLKTNTSGGAETSKRVYKMNSDQLNKYWLALVFQGKAKAPVFFNSVTDMLNYISQTPGAIGIIDSESTTGVRLITVDGKHSF